MALGVGAASLLCLEGGGGGGKGGEGLTWHQGRQQASRAA